MKDSDLLLVDIGIAFIIVMAAALVIWPCCMAWIRRKQKIERANTLGEGVYRGIEVEKLPPSLSLGMLKPQIRSTVDIGGLKLHLSGPVDISRARVGKNSKLIARENRQYVLIEIED